MILALLIAPPPPDPVGRGAAAPGFTLPALDGTSRSLEDLRGRVVLLNFWATWCKPCEDEMPSMQRLYQRLSGRPFELLAISVDTDRDAVRAFRERLGLSFPILLDPDSRVAKAYQTTGYPESFLIGPEGTIVSQRFVGPRQWDDAAYLSLVQRVLRDAVPGAP